MYFRNVMRVCFILLVSVMLGACSSLAGSNDQPKTVQSVMMQYGTLSKQQLVPYFSKAHVNYPPKQLSILVFKHHKQLQLYAIQHKQWYYIKSFPIYAASGVAGPKLHQGDLQVPEGVYHIIKLNPNSHFNLSMQLNYPNSFDLMHAKLSRRTDLGNDIFIHGRRKSVGCIAIGDDGIEQLFPLVDEVGISHVQVIIAPDDLRKYAPIYSHFKPKWLPVLYQHLTAELAKYPLVTRASG